MKNKNNNFDFLSKCSFCGNDLGAECLTLLEEKEQKATLHATCVKCNTSAIFFVSNNPAGVLGMGVMTDLDRDEVGSKFSMGAVSADEVIDAHRFVSRGDMMGLLK